ncbi:hypothetical protein [Apibacter mensalis]|uniref:hypothetical protein n=1 Tax=Apibacter mensalis TaxID=1586267 RepID=UPI0012E2D4D6|nr:hypothetical protein [Apibacter mensalis]
MFIISLLFTVACNGKEKYPKQVGNKLYVTDSTFHYMDGNDTITKLLDERTGKLEE